MAAAAEQQTRFLPPPQFDEQVVFVVPELTHDMEVRSKAASFIGAVATGAWHEDVQTEEALTVRPLESLYDAVKAAAEGDPVAYKMVETNVSTDVIERTIKAGHIMQVDLMVDEAGTIQQHGQSMESVQANSLRFASGNRQMRRRVEAETRNAFRIKHYYDTGILNDYYFVVFSRAADDMTKSSARKAGFFTDTMSCAIQLTFAQGDRLVTESAFVAGKTDPQAERHDKETIRKTCAMLGVDIGDMGATELLDTPLLIHKSRLPLGASSLVELYDEAKGDTFFGQTRPRQDYSSYRQKCRERENDFKPKVKEIITELLTEAPQITSRVMATRRLHKISGKHMIELSVIDRLIDPSVFGEEAAARIEVARWHIEQGNHELARKEVKEAVKKDGSNSCPTGLFDEDSNIEDDENDAAADESDEDCEFESEECPECHAKKVWTTVKKISPTEKRIEGTCGCRKTVKSGSLK